MQASRRRIGLTTGLVLALLAAALVAVVTQPSQAHAQQGQAQHQFSPDRISFGGVDAESRAVRIVGDQLWVGGAFVTARDADQTTVVERTGLAIFDMNRGDLLPIDHRPNGEVRDIESDDTAIIWAGGEFTQIAGQNISYLAAFDGLTGQLISSFNLNLDGPVYDLHYANGWLYVGGIFRSANGEEIDRLLRLDPDTGIIDMGFQPNPNASVRSIDTFEDRVYVSGFFERIGSGANRADRRWVAGLDAESGDPLGPDFVLAPLASNEGTKKLGVRRLEISVDGSTLYTGDRRNDLIAWDRETGQERWRRPAEGDIQAIHVAGSSIYVGTHDGLLAKNDKRLLFALTADGDIDETFVPLMNSFAGTEAIHVGQGALVAVGAFTRVNDELASRIAVFHSPDFNGATPLGNPADGRMPGDANCDGVVDLGDALTIAQFSVGTRTASASCTSFDRATQIGPGGDVNGDGATDLGDALLVSQCSVGVVNPFCPDG